jgi:hypothetical protein
MLQCRIQQAPAGPDKLEVLCQNRLGADAMIEKNKTATFALGKKASESGSIQQVQFIVIRLADLQVVEEGSVSLAEVVWTGDYEISIQDIPGQVKLNRDENSFVRKIDLKKYILHP